METQNPNQRHPFLSFLTKTLELMLIVSMGLLVIDVLWGVLSRILASSGILSGQSSWTEELARYLMIWVGLLGASLAFESRAHLGVDYFVNKLDPSGRKILKLAALTVVLAFAVGVLMIGGWQLVSHTLELKQDTPALGIPKGWVYLAVPISGVFTALFTLGHMWDVLLDRDELPHSIEKGLD
jgi:TRAP-type C4-dicarboxylate transport system permease small subunit